MTDYDWGIESEYMDAFGRRQVTPVSTRKALMAAMGLEPEMPAPHEEAEVCVLLPGRTLLIEEASELTLEDGAVMRVEKKLPPDLPWGYHRLRRLKGGGTVLVIASPGLCYLPPRLRIWGWAVQLYALRSAGSWGMGDLADLRDLAQWSRGLGAGLVQVNPLLAVTPTVPQERSPYSPTSRLYKNFLYLRIEEAPGAAETGVDLSRLATAGRKLNDEGLIDRDSIFRLKSAALKKLWLRFGGDPAFDRYRAEEGKTLEYFATFCVLAKYFGGGWHHWPSEYCRPDSPAVARFAEENKGSILFEQWIQWLLDEQFKKAASGTPLMQDLPIGVDHDGADAWLWQDVLALGATVGAPPDEFSASGQNWGFPPFIPHRLREAGYQPFIKTLRSTLRHAGGLRIDHVMGLFRLFWIPRGASPSQGGYVRYEAEELLAILALESQRAKALVVGEDLGTVAPGVRRKLARRRILSNRVLWFETKPPSSYPELALASVSTHDLPTSAGLWSGRDLEEQRELGLAPNEKGLGKIRRRLAKVSGLPDGAEVQKVIIRTHQRLAEAPSKVVTASLEDALAVEARPNIPNTTNERPNWSMALPKSLEALVKDPLALSLAWSMGWGRQGRPVRAGRKRRTGRRAGIIKSDDFVKSRHPS